MNPYKAPELYQEIANETGVSLENIQLINSFYWKMVRSTLSEMVNPHISLIGLGEMDIKHWKVQDKIDELTRKKNYWDKRSNSSSSTISKTYTGSLAKVCSMKEMIERDDKKRKEFELKRKEYESNQSLEK